MRKWIGAVSLLLLLSGCSEEDKTEEVYGTVESVNPSGSVQISITDNEGENQTIDITADDSITVIKDDSSVSLEDLCANEKIIAAFRNNRLQVIQVLDNTEK